MLVSRLTPVRTTACRTWSRRCQRAGTVYQCWAAKNRPVEEAAVRRQTFDNRSRIAGGSASAMVHDVESSPLSFPGDRLTKADAISPDGMATTLRPNTRIMNVNSRPAIVTGYTSP